jgi:hypothetical protein
MIYIIGTIHSVQVWSDAKRHNTSFDASKEMMMAFENYLEETAKSLNANMIAEEACEEWILKHGQGASSVAKDVAIRSGIGHLFCDPDSQERRSIGLKVGPELTEYVRKVAADTGRQFDEVYREEREKGFAPREAIWIERLYNHEPNNRTLIFVCGADHVETFRSALDARQIMAEVYCRDWTELADR